MNITEFPGPVNTKSSLALHLCKLKSFDRVKRYLARLGPMTRKARTTSYVGINAVKMANIQLALNDSATAAGLLDKAKQIFSQQLDKLHPEQIKLRIARTILLLQEGQQQPALTDLRDIKSLLAQAKWHSPEIDRRVFAIEQLLQHGSVCQR